MIKRLVQQALRSRGIELQRVGKPPGGPGSFRLRNKRETLELIRSAGFTPDVVFDIGVADGTEGLYSVWDEPHYLLVEPLEKFTRDLELICSRFKSARFYIAGAGEALGELSITVDPDERYNIQSAKISPAGGTRITVPIVTVDSLLSDLPAERSVSRAVLKIDVDGTEISVLKGAAAVLRLETVVIIEAALLDESVGRFGKIVEFMCGAGYECFDIIEPMYRGDGILWQVDLVFLPRNSAIRGKHQYFAHYAK